MLLLLTMKQKITLSILIFGLYLLDSANSSSTSSSTNESTKSHHRQKRLFWITNDGRIALPPGTVMTITPTIALPFVRYPPHGFLSNMTISLPFTVDFDKLGLTDNENPYGALPPIFSRGMESRDAGVLMADFIASFIKRRLQKRELEKPPPANAFHGGERAILYGTAEDLLSTLGLDGKACLLRAICEVQGHPLSNFGLIGEMLKLFFTASKSPFANLLNEYVEAEKRGKMHGECWPYFKKCSKSLFLPTKNRYSKAANSEDIKVEEHDERKNIFKNDELEEHNRHNSNENILNPSM